ncbi:MAG: hypothetical protein JWN48_44, partial [Myxococcaceae bacterium]|nr:hypothetical protein [Myxococcaceae bacterium]
ALFTGPEIAERLAALEEDGEPGGVAPSRSPLAQMLRKLGGLRLVLSVGIVLLLIAWSIRWAVHEPAPAPRIEARSLERRTLPAAPTPSQEPAAAQAQPSAAPSPIPAAPSNAAKRDGSSEKRGAGPARRRRRAPDFVATPGF